MKRLRKTVVLFVSLLLCVTIVNAKEDTAWIADFEKDPRPEGWRFAGYAFGTLTPGKLPFRAAVADLNQRQFMSGTMNSKPFSVEKKHLVLEMAGVFNPGCSYVDVMVEGETVSGVRLI